MAGFLSRFFGRKSSVKRGKRKRVRGIEVFEIHQEVSLRHKGLWNAIYTLTDDPPFTSHHVKGKIWAHTRHEALDIAKARLARKGFDVSMRSGVVAPKAKKAEQFLDTPIVKPKKASKSRGPRTTVLPAWPWR
jgi:hypothetical protein